MTEGMMNHSETIAALAAALVKAQSAIKPAIKDKTNPAFRSKYADLGAVWEACRDPLTTNGLSVVQMPVTAEPGHVALTTMLLHESGEYISSTVTVPITKNDPQGVGSALTYARRYALSAIVGVVADEDDDGNAASRAQAQAQAQTREPAQYQTNGATNGGAGITEKQLGMLRGKAKAREWSESDVVNFAADHGIRVAKVADLTSQQASTLIGALVAADAPAT